MKGRHHQRLAVLLHLGSVSTALVGAAVGRRQAFQLFHHGAEDRHRPLPCDLEAGLIAYINEAVASGAGQYAVPHIVGTTAINYEVREPASATLGQYMTQ